MGEEMATAHILILIGSIKEQVHEKENKFGGWGSRCTQATAEMSVAQLSQDYCSEFNVPTTQFLQRQDLYAGGTTGTFYHMVG